MANAKRIVWNHSGRNSHSVRFTVERIDKGMYRVELLSCGFGYIATGRKIRPMYEKGLSAYLSYANGFAA